MGEKLVLLGAGSAMFTRGLVADLIERGMDVELALVDTDPAALDVAERLSRRMVNAANSDVRVIATVDRRDVLADATVVITTIGVGGRRAWEWDIHLPRKYGIYAAVGDTVGPGGASRAMRTIPAMVAIAQDVLDLATPDALFLNYTNPMSPVCRAVRKATGAQIVGLCHGAMGSVARLAALIRTPLANVDFRVAGYNHLTWITSLTVGGRELMDDLLQVARQQSTPELADDALDNQPRPVPPNEDFNPFSWRMLTLFGAFPAPGDRHVTEFFPAIFRDGDYFGMRLGVHRGAFSFEDHVSWGDTIYDRMASDAHSAAALDKSYLETTPGGTQVALQLLEDIRSGRQGTYTANLQNNGAIPNLPPEAIVEANATAGHGGIRLIDQRPLPTSLAGPLAGWFLWAELIVEAALEGSRKKFIQALASDGYIRSLDEAESIGDELLSAHHTYLPWLDGTTSSRTSARL